MASSALSLSGITSITSSGSNITSRSPTCLACLRRLVRPGQYNAINVGVGVGVSFGGITPRPPFSFTQTRGKRLKAQGVVVRLLEDVPKFGRRHTIFRVQAGRMRNLWFPNKQAEYMTPERFAELGLTREAIGERDPTYEGAAADFAAEEFAAAAEEAAAAAAAAALAAQIAVDHVTPARAHALIERLVPPTLSFARKTIQSSSSSSEATAAVLSLPGQPIFGSVSTVDVAHEVRRALDASADPQAARVVVEPAHVRFVGVGVGVGLAAEGGGVVDRVKALGRFEVEISLVGSGSGEEEILPVTRVVEVLPTSDAAH